MAEPEPTLAQRQAQQLAAWRKARADLHRAQRNKRGRRPEPEITGVVVPPPDLPRDGAK
jgi:hypothetical protein